MNKSILVTGAGKGLGLSITKKHLEDGDYVYALEYQITNELKELEAAYSALTVKQCDIGKTEEVKEAMAELVTSEKQINILYNIAGIFFASDRVGLAETDIDRCLQLYNVNALGPLRVMQNALPLLKSGSLVLNVTSESGSVADCHRKGEYGYGMSKSAFNIASKIFSNQLEGQNIRVLCYHPGWMKTDMGGEDAQQCTWALTPDQAADALRSITLHPESVPDYVMYLDYQRHWLNW